MMAQNTATNHHKFTSKVAGPNNNNRPTNANQLFLSQQQNQVVHPSGITTVQKMHGQGAQKVGRPGAGQSQKQRAVSSTRRQAQFHQQGNNMSFVNVQTAQNVNDGSEQPLGINRMFSAPSDRGKAANRQATGTKKFALPQHDNQKPLFINKNFVNLQSKQTGQSGAGLGNGLTPKNNQAVGLAAQAPHARPPFGQRNHSDAVNGNSAFASKLNAQLQQQYLHDIDKAMAQVNYNVMTPQNNLKFRGAHQGVRAQGQPIPQSQNLYGTNMNAGANKVNQVGFFDNRRAQSNPRAAAGPGAYEKTEASTLVHQTAGLGPAAKQRSSSRPKRASNGPTTQQVAEAARQGPGMQVSRAQRQAGPPPRYATIQNPGGATHQGTTGQVAGASTLSTDPPDGAANTLYDQALGTRPDQRKHDAAAVNSNMPSEQMQAPMSREEVQKLVFSNSNAVMISSEIIGDERDVDNAKHQRQQLKNANIQIVNTNHQFLVDQNITASNMMSSHQNADRRLFAGRTNGLIHVNDQSQEQTDDNAASSQTHNEEGQLTAGDEANFTHMSGALIMGSGTSEYTGGSLPSVGAQLLGQTQARVYCDGEIQITTGAYSLHKTDDIILNESLQQEHPDLNMASRISPDDAHAEEAAGHGPRSQNKNAILVQTNDVNVMESANTEANNSSAQSSSAQNVGRQDGTAGQKQRARTNQKPAEARPQQKISQSKGSGASGIGQNVYDPMNTQYTTHNEQEYGLQNLNNFLSNRQIGLNSDLTGNEHQAFNRKTTICVNSPTAAADRMFFDKAMHVRNVGAQGPLSPQAMAIQANRNVIANQGNQKRVDGVNQQQLGNRNQGKTASPNAGKANQIVKKQNSQNRYNKNKTDMRRLTTITASNNQPPNNNTTANNFKSIPSYPQSNQIQLQRSQMTADGEDQSSMYSNQRAIIGQLGSQVSSPMNYTQTANGNGLQAPKAAQNGQNSRHGSRARGSKIPAAIGPATAGFSSLVTAKQTKAKDPYPSRAVPPKHQTINVTSPHPSRQPANPAPQPPAQQPGYFYQKRQTNLAANNRQILSENTLTPDVPALPDFHDPKEAGVTQGYNRDQRAVIRNVGNSAGRRAQSNVRNTSQVSGVNARQAGQKQRNKSTFRNKQGLQLQNMFAIDDYTDNTLFEVANTKPMPKTSTNAQNTKIIMKTTAPTSNAKPNASNQKQYNPNLSGPNTRANSQAQQIYKEMSGNRNEPRQHVLSALQNPTSQLAPFGSMGATSPLNMTGQMSPQVHYQNSDIPDLDGTLGGQKRNNFFTKAENGNKLGTAGADGQAQSAFNQKKLSKSIVVYHQMKSNLMQNHGLQRGSRYAHGKANAMMSEENFEEHFNSLLLANSPANAMSTEIHPTDMRGQGIGGQESNNVERSVDGLTEALEDHILQNKQSNRRPGDQEDHEKYHLRIKTGTGHAKTDDSQQNRSQHTAATSAGAAASGNYINFHSRKLAPRAGGPSKHLADSEAQAQQHYDNERLALSGLLTSSINESNFTNEKQKISNQNALLSLLSQDDFSHLKNRIHGKFIGSVTAGGPIEEGVEDEDIDLLSQGVLSQGDECVTRPKAGGPHANVAKPAETKSGTQ